MSESVNIVEKHRKLHHAASYRSREENPEFDDITYLSFVKVMLYRREIAIKMISTKDDKMFSELETVYEYCNQQIKDILAL